MPPARITELLHEVNRGTGFASAFTNLRTGECCDDLNALLAAILADATNLGLGRMAAASHGVTRDKLSWTANAYISPDTHRRRWPGSSAPTTRCPSRPPGATAPPRPPTASSSARPSAATPPAR